MNLDDLKDPWKQKHSELAGGRFDELATHVHTRAASFENKVLQRDLVETAAAVLVIAVFVFFSIQIDYPRISKVGMAIIILGAVEIVIVLHRTRRQGDQRRQDLPLIEYCAAEISRVDRQIYLLRNVNWWYTGPLLFGACLFFFGILFAVQLPLYVSLPMFAVICGLIWIFGWIVYRINQRAVAQELVPLRDELSAIHAALKDAPLASDG